MATRAGLAPIPSSRGFRLERKREKERERKSSSAPIEFFGSQKICGARVRDDLDVHLI